jgi:hypothetical protein
MALNDEAERLKTAEDYLLNFPSSSQEFEAALEHVQWVRRQKPELRKQCDQIMSNVVFRRRDEMHTMAKLGTVKNR